MTTRNLLLGLLSSGILSIEAQIIREYDAVSWTTYCIFLARAGDLNLASGDADIWTNRGNAGVGNATQGTASARPTWNATGLNGKGVLEHDGGDYMRTPTFDVQSETASVLTVLYSDTTVAGIASPAEYGRVLGGNEGLLIQTFNTEPYLRVVGYGGTVADAISASGGIGMDTPDVVSATWDSARTSEESEVRHAGANVTDSYPSNGNNGVMFGANYYLNIGGRYTGGGLLGDVAAVVLAAGNTAIPVAAVANVEAILGTEWGV